MSVDFEKQIVDIAKTIPAGYELASETIPMATEAVYGLDERYGTDSDNHLEFHNAPHSVDVLRRDVRVTKLLLPYVQPMYLRRIFDLAVLGPAYHDWEQLLGPGKNEAASVDYATGQVEEKGGRKLNTKVFKGRLGEVISASAVTMLDSGEIIQTNIQSGSHDPAKFNLAFADINGIAMEGPRRMIRDGTHLYLETVKDPSFEGLYPFLVDERRFLRQRLNDIRVKSDIAYYYPDDIEEVYAVMRKAFHANIDSAHRLAIDIGARPELKIPIGIVAKSVSTVDRAILGDTLGNLIRRKLT
jgi:hypothetical protein